jgi:diacylglycerol O-acyltransferase
MQKLTGMDSMFISLESGTNLFNVGAVAVFDPSTAPDDSPPPYVVLRQIVENRLHLVPPFRRRLVEVPGGLDHPRWIDDPEPDLERHVRRAALPSPGGEAELSQFAAEVMSHPLDRSRPLWEMHVVEGLEGGLIAGVAKIHHSAIDGLSGAETTAHLMDLTPEVAHLEPPAQSPTPERTPNSLSLLGQAALNSARRAIPTAKALSRVSMAAMRIRNHNRVPDTLAPPGPFDGPRTCFTRPLGSQRAVGLAHIDRDDAEAVRKQTGATLNDVVLAVTGCALRHYLEDRGELPDEPLVSFVPVAVRSEGDSMQSNTNRLSGMLVSLATDVADPVVQLMSVSESSRGAKAQDRLLGSDLFSAMFDLAVPALLRPAGRLARAVGFTTRWPPFSLVVSSFPGPPVPLYCGGSELVAYHPFGPVIDGAALNVTAMSYRDQIGFGLIACRDAVKDIDTLAQWIPESMRELTKAVNTSRVREQRKTPTKNQRKSEVLQQVRRAGG